MLTSNCAEAPRLIVGECNKTPSPGREERNWDEAGLVIEVGYSCLTSVNLIQKKFMKVLLIKVLVFEKNREIC